MAPTPVNTESPPCPFVGLEPFDENTRQYYFGRDREGDSVIQLLLATRLSILHGRSGVGKSSLLQAYVGPKLAEQPHFVPVYFNAWRPDAFVELRKKLSLTLSGNGVLVSQEAPLDKQVELASDRGRSVFLLLDQFESFFTSPGPEWDAELARLANRPNVRCGILLGIRNDRLELLDHLDWRIPTLRMCQQGLAPMGRDNALVAIKGPLNKVQIGFDPTLPESVLDGVTRSDDTVELAHLQLVMKLVFKHQVIDKKNRYIPAEVLEELSPKDERFNEPRAVDRILLEFMERRLNELPSDEKDACVELFDLLTSPSGRRQPQTEEDLFNGTRVPPELVSRTLDSLQKDKARIVRRITANSWEITHDSLARVARHWADWERMQWKTEEIRERERGLLPDELQANLRRVDEDRKNAEESERLSTSRRLAAQALLNKERDPELALALCRYAADRCGWITQLTLELKTSVSQAERNLILELGTALRQSFAQFRLSAAGRVVDADVRSSILSIVAERGEPTISDYDLDVNRSPEETLARVSAWGLGDLYRVAGVLPIRSLSSDEAREFLDISPGEPIPAIPATPKEPVPTTDPPAEPPDPGVTVSVEPDVLADILQENTDAETGP